MFGVQEEQQGARCLSGVTGVSSGRWGQRKYGGGHQSLRRLLWIFIVRWGRYPGGFEQSSDII